MNARLRLLQLAKEFPYESPAQMIILQTATLVDPDVDLPESEIPQLRQAFTNAGRGSKLERGLAPNNFVSHISGLSKSKN